MSREFVEGRYGNAQLRTAKRQQEHLSYFTQSDVQTDISANYVEQWATRQYATNDYFLTWIKNIFRTENFLTMYKYLRFPLPSAKLINDDIIPQLNRVFTAEDAYRRYSVRGVPIEAPEALEFDEFVREVFQEFLFGYNNIIFTDLSDINKPYRQIIDICNVVALEAEKDEIKRIAYAARTKNLEEWNIYPGYTDIEGYVYADEKEYIFYDKEYKVITQVPHDLGECPADFVSQESFFNKKDFAVRKSIFSYVREELEEYVFLKTLLKMTNPNGAIPVVTMLQTQITNNRQGREKKSNQEPMTANEIGGAHSRVGSSVAPPEGQLQTGSVIKIVPQKDAQGKIDMSLVTDYFKFHYVPIECLEYINTRIEELKSSIVSSVVGHYKDNVDVAKNDKQVNTGLIEKQDNLKRVADNLSKVLTKADFKFLALQHGRENVSVDVFLGTDFFLESADELYDLIEKSPNPIEGRRILERLSKNRNRNNPTMAKRELILYNLIPFADNKDFTVALAQQIVDDYTKLLQLRFNYWIDQFEAQYGDIVAFWNEVPGTDKEKTVFISNLIRQEVEKTKIPPKEAQQQTV